MTLPVRAAQCPEPSRRARWEKSQVPSVHRTRCSERGNEAAGLPNGPTCDRGGAMPAQARGPAASAQPAPSPAAGSRGVDGDRAASGTGQRAQWSRRVVAGRPGGSASPRGKFLGPERCNCVQLFLVCQAAGRRGAASRESPGQGRRVEEGRMRAGAHPAQTF